MTEAQRQIIQRLDQILGSTPAGSGGAAANIPTNPQSTAYSTTLSDNGKAVVHPLTDDNARDFTINNSVAYPVGAAITFINLINTVTIKITSGTLRLAGGTSTGDRTLANGGVATAIKVATDYWIASGVGLT